MVADNVVSSVIERIRRKRVENSAGLSVNMSILSAQVIYHSAWVLTPCWKMFPCFNIRDQNDKKDVKIGRILGVSWPKVAIRAISKA